MVDRVRRPADFDQILSDLTVSGGIFKTYKDVLVFAASLGFKRQFKKEFSKTSEPIELHIFHADFDQSVLNCIGVAETSDHKILANERDAEKIRIFEEYAYGGLEIMKNEIWEQQIDWEDGLVTLILREDDSTKGILDDIRGLSEI
jgi:dnd system-associated protein 4